MTEETNQNTSQEPAADGGAPETSPPPASPAQPPSPPGAQGIEQDKDARTMGMLCHLLGIFTCFLGPLIIWLIKKDESPFVDDQGKESLNWQLTLLIAYVIAWFTVFILIGFLLLPALWVVNLVFGIMGTIAANNGERYRYPFKIPFIK